MTRRVSPKRDIECEREITKRWVVGGVVVCVGMICFTYGAVQISQKDWTDVAVTVVAPGGIGSYLIYRIWRVRRFAARVESRTTEQAPLPPRDSEGTPT